MVSDIRSTCHPFQQGSHTLRIGYFGVAMARPQDVVYRYRLEGVDRDWQAADTRTEAVYTNLHPGSYTFRAAASNKRDVWVEATPYSFTVLPSFYQTRWFLGLCLCAAGTFPVVYFSAADTVRRRTYPGESG